MSIDEGWSDRVTPTGAEPLAPGDERRPATPGEQLEALRQLAKDWRGGQLGILGLVSIITLIKGGSTVGQLSPLAAAATGVLILASLVTACFAVFSLSSVAWGWPRLQAQPADRIYYDHQRLSASMGRVRNGIVFTFVSVLLLAAALGLTWYAPVKASNLVRVQQLTGQICGQLVQENPRTLVLSVGGQDVPVKLADVVGLSPVSSC